MLRVGRTKAYAMAAEWRATGGDSPGLPVVDFGQRPPGPAAASSKHSSADRLTRWCPVAGPAKAQRDDVRMRRPTQPAPVAAPNQPSPTADTTAPPRVDHDARVASPSRTSSPSSTHCRTDSAMPTTPLQRRQGRAGTCQPFGQAHSSVVVPGVVFGTGRC